METIIILQGIDPKLQTEALESYIAKVMRYRTEAKFYIVVSGIDPQVRFLGGNHAAKIAHGELQRAADKLSKKG